MTKKKSMSTNKIYIDPKNKGTFTAWCKRQGYGGVTEKCIQKGKRSKNPTTRKRATFAYNSRHKFNKKK